MNSNPKMANVELEKLAKRLYKGDLAKGFLLWGLSCLTADQSIDEEELIDHTLDGAGDLGIDGYWIDEANSSLLLFQAKYSSREEFSVGDRAAKELRASAENLRDQDYVREHGNRLIREVHADILEVLLDDAYTLHLVLATNKKVSRRAHTYAQRAGSAPWRFEHEGQEHTKDVVMEVLSVDDLSTQRGQLLVGTEQAPDVVLEVPSGLYHEISGAFRAAQATVRAQDIVDAYHTYRGSIFRLNIRGPLGSNKVNKDIVQSLRDPQWRENFHILNNGLTILCEAFTYDESGSKLQIRDFQVVNGCQTTYTLHENKDLLEGRVLLKIMVVEGPTWAHVIARSTNSQSVVKAEDFRTLDKVQDSIKEKFGQMTPPWLYEKKRGESRFRTAMEQRRDDIRYGERRLTMRETAQAALSFIGKPAMAKWDLRILFDPQDSEGKRLYSAIFSEGVAPEQLLLPTMVSRQVYTRVREIVKGSPAQRFSPMDKEITEVDWLPYARTHLVGLIGELLRLGKSGEVTDVGFLAPVKCRSLIATLDDWFPEDFKKAVDAVRFRIEVAKSVSKEEKRPLPNLREFFRRTREYDEMAKYVRGLPGSPEA